MQLVSVAPNVYETTETEELPIEKGAKIIRIEYGDGIRTYLEGHLYPYKGYPTTGAIQAIGIIKKLFLSWPFLSKKRIEQIGMIAIKPYILQPKYMTHCARELRTMIPGDIGILISHVIEYDSAYRLRFQDLMSSTDEYFLGLEPRYIIKQLLKINGERDYRSVHKKIKRVAHTLMLLLLYPPFKSKWKKALLNCTFQNLQLDEGDEYWLAQRTDYGPNRTNV